MGTGQILREVFESRVQDQIGVIEFLAQNNANIDLSLIKDALNKITEHYYENNIEEIKRKANSYDLLYDEISKCYGEEKDGEYIENDDCDLSDIGEIAASHFGFLNF